jgi:hypothetical protein
MHQGSVAEAAQLAFKALGNPMLIAKKSPIEYQTTSSAISRF